MSKVALITGITGQDGAYLADFLLKKGYAVFGTYRRLSTPNFWRLQYMDIFKKVHLIPSDMIDSDSLYEALFLSKPDEIYNLACPASPVHYQYDPVQTTKTSVHGSINMLGLAKRTKAKILLASTSEVYGDPTQHPQQESYWGNVNPIGPRSCYDEGKRCAETLFFDYFRQHNLDIKVGRIFNTYGPKMDFFDGRVISNFIVQCIKNKNLTIHGKGKQTRSFCYIDDMVDALIKFMNLKSNFTGPLNLGNPYEINIFKVAKKIKSLFLTGHVLCVSMQLKKNS